MCTIVIEMYTITINRCTISVSIQMNIYIKLLYKCILLLNISSLSQYRCIVNFPDTLIKSIIFITGILMKRIRRLKFLHKNNQNHQAPILYVMYSKILIKANEHNSFLGV